MSKFIPRFPKWYTGFYFVKIHNNRFIMNALLQINLLILHNLHAVIFGMIV